MGAKLASLSGVLGATQDRGLSFITSTTFSAASSVSVDGCFDASFDNYRLVVSYTASANDAVVSLRYRAAAADNTTANYTVFGGYGTAYDGTSASLVIGRTVGIQTIIADILSPADSSYTAAQYIATRHEKAVVANYYAGLVSFSDTTQFSGLSLISGTGTFTGNLAIYGYRLS